MRAQPDGTRSLQWGNASSADTTTGQTGATPTPKPRQKDSTSASVVGQSYCPSDSEAPVTQVPESPRYPYPWLHLIREMNAQPLPDFKPMNLQKSGYLVSITDEQLGLAEVWPVEVLSEEAQAAARKERELQQRQRLINLTARLALAPEALHPIIELHSPGTSSWSLDECQGCDAGSYAEEAPGWPCRTIDLILEGL